MTTKRASAFVNIYVLCMCVPHRACDICVHFFAHVFMDDNLLCIHSSHMYILRTVYTLFAHVYILRTCIYFSHCVYILRTCIHSSHMYTFFAHVFMDDNLLCIHSSHMYILLALCIHSSHMYHGWQSSVYTFRSMLTCIHVDLVKRTIIAMYAWMHLRIHGVHTRHKCIYTCISAHSQPIHKYTYKHRYNSVRRPILQALDTCINTTKRTYLRVKHLYTP